MKLFKKILIGAILFLTVPPLVWLGILVSKGHDAAILMYHSVGEKDEKKGQLDISTSSFEAQMAFLKKYKYNVISFEDLVQSLKLGRKIPFKTVVITFDDGYENNYTQAWPVLKKYGFPATIFIITDAIGFKREMYGHVFKFMASDMVKELSESGLITIGSHTQAHKFLPDVKEEGALLTEIAGSKAVLENMIQKPVRFFCYPSGGYTAGIEKIVSSVGYEAAVTTLPKKKGFAHKDIYALKRIKATEDNGKNLLKFFVMTSGYYLRMKEMSS